MAEQGVALTGDELKDTEYLQKLVQEELAKQEAAKRAQTLGSGGQFTAEELAAILANGGAGKTTPQPGPIKATIGGQEYEFKDPQELALRVEQALELARRAGIEEASKTAPKEPPKADTYDEKHFEELLKSDTRKALDYALKFSETGQRLQGAEREANQLKMALLGYQFKEAIPGFEPTPTNVGVLQQYVANMGARPDNLGAWQAAYYTAVAQGAIKPKAAAAENNGGNGNGFSGVAAPPSFGRSASPPQPDFMAQVQDMSLDQIERLMERVRRGH